MNLSTIAQGLRLIAKGLEEPGVIGSPTTDPVPVPATKSTPTPEAAPAALSMYGAAAIAPANQPAPAAPDHTQSKTVAREDVISAFTQLFQAKGQDAVVGILKARGLNRISEAQPEQLADLYAAAVGAANV